MSLYVVGPHGGAAFPLTVGLPQIQIAENGKDVVLTSGSYSVIMFNGKDNNDAKAMLSQIVKAIDPAPVFIANLAGGTSTPPAPVAP